MTASERGTGRRAGVGAMWIAVVALLALTAESVGAQEGMTVTLGPVVSRRLDRDGGPGLGKLGMEARWFRSGGDRTTWGFALGYHPLGRFPNPSPGDYFDETVWALGPRIRRLLGSSQRPFVTLGVDVLRVTSDNPPTSGSDPALGAFLGLGYSLTRRTSPVGLFLEAGVHSLAATGELTAGSGHFGSLILGIAF